MQVQLKKNSFQIRLLDGKTLLFFSLILSPYFVSSPFVSRLHYKSNLHFANQILLISTRAHLSAENLDLILCLFFFQIKFVQSLIIPIDATTIGNLLLRFIWTLVHCGRNPELWTIISEGGHQGTQLLRRWMKGEDFPPLI